MREPSPTLRSRSRRSPGGAVLACWILAACGGPADRAQEPPAPPAATDPEVSAASLPPETDLPPRASADLPLAGDDLLVLRPGGRLTLRTGTGQRSLSSGVLGVPSVDESGRTAVWAEPIGHGPQTRIRLLRPKESGEGWQVRTRLAGAGDPDRPALSPDGSVLVWVSAATGVPALWIDTVAPGGAEPLTNRQVDRSAGSPGQPPPGYIPVPHRSAPRITALPHASPDAIDVAAVEGAAWRIAWEAPDGPHALEVK